MIVDTLTQTNITLNAVAIFYLAIDSSSDKLYGNMYCVKLIRCFLFVSLND